MKEGHFFVEDDIIANQQTKTLEPKLILLESPFAGDFENNMKYARRCMRDSFLRGEYPFASHLLYTQEGILDDTIQEERNLGINAGLKWGQHATKTIVYTDLGISGGMKYGIEQAKKDGRIIEYRSIFSPEEAQ